MNKFPRSLQEEKIEDPVFDSGACSNLVARDKDQEAWIKNGESKR